MGVTVDGSSVISELALAADDFAARALVQEAFRDRARPGTGVHHQHAHSATLWRMAEACLRARIQELELGAAAIVESAAGDRSAGGQRRRGSSSRSA
ncbi:MAG TPA: hypothetical protein VGD39_05220 [Nocardioides sp.]|jgi:hypothetical protein